uniref:Uncharacterized protein n=1 Tax=Clastoptera arizonana TaxID=38151 RepID=A0A1B6DPB5_9HEMI
MPVQQINVSPIEWQSGNVDSSNIYKNAQIHCRNTPPYDGSQSSSISSASYDICRICHCEGDSEVPLIEPCYCAGSLRYVHQACLQQWIKSSNIRSCELCKFQFIMHTKTKPLSEWEHLEMSGFERRKLLCAVMFHAVALTCVVWSLYVLIDRTAEEIQNGMLEWPFWTKLIVVAIGFTGGVVFMYIQCKAYLQICQRWKAFNRVIYIQNAPEKPSLPSPIAQLHVVPSQPIVGPSHSISEIQPTSSENQFKPYQDGSHDSTAEETSIDLKNVRNLHIFFNDENRIRVQKEDLESCTVDLENISNEHLENGSGVSQRTDQEGLGTSWHIKIGKTKDPGGKGKNITMSSSSHRCGDENYGIPAEVNNSIWPNNVVDKITKNNEGSNSIGESSVLKLQINKAEIVIKFGQKPNNNSDILCMTEEKSEGKNDVVKVDSKENISDTKMIFVKDIVDKTKAEEDLLSADSVHEEAPEDSSTASGLLLPSSLCECTDVIPPPSPDQCHSEPGSGSQTPLLTNKGMEDKNNISKVD